MNDSKRATVYFDADVHWALRVKAAAADRSISDVVNEAVKVALAEDVEELVAFEERQAERSVSFESVVRALRTWPDIGCSSSPPLERREALGRKKDRQRIVNRIAAKSIVAPPEWAE